MIAIKSVILKVTVVDILIFSNSPVAISRLSPDELSHIVPIILKYCDFNEIFTSSVRKTYPFRFNSPYFIPLNIWRNVVGSLETASCILFLRILTCNNRRIPFISICCFGRYLFCVDRFVMHVLIYYFSFQFFASLTYVLWFFRV